MPTETPHTLPILATTDLPPDAAPAKKPCVGCIRTKAVLYVLLDVMLVWAVFFAIAGRPTPDTNEAHYLTKAKHFWDAGWIRGDQFLSSADSHVVFYATFGWLTNVLTLPSAAWVGRILIWLLMASGWRRLSQNFAPGFGWAALTAAAALCLNVQLHMSGEWFVGGCEAKGVAYGLVFWGLADVTAGRWNRGFITLGAASAFHVLVGGWSVFAAGFVLLCDRRARPAFRHFAPGLVVGGLLALAGVVPGLALARGAAPDDMNIANRVYVFERLAHHLWACSFAPEFKLRQLLLWVVWAVICRTAIFSTAVVDGPLRRLRWFALASITASLVGTAISYASPEPSDWAAALLKFYWFRLADVAVALSVTFELAAKAASLPKRSIGRYALVGVLLAAGGYQIATVRLELRRTEGLARGEAIGDVPTLERWLDVCEWIRMNSARDSVVLAPRVYTTFKWHAERAEYATWKDIPQDAHSLVEWQARLRELYDVDGRWINYMPHERIRAVCRKYGVTHIVTYLEPPLPFPEAYRNDVFVVYRVDAGTP